jgi:hypothetical protein
MKARPEGGRTRSGAVPFEALFLLSSPAEIEKAQQPSLQVEERVVK